MFIADIQRTQESRNTKNTTSEFRYETFYYLLSLKVLRHKERDTHSFYSGFSICPHISCGTRHKTTGLASASKRKPTIFSRGRTQLTDFFKIPPPNPPRALPVHDVIHISWSWEFYFDICEQHILPACALTPALKFAPNTCVEPKGSQPN